MSERDGNEFLQLGRHLRRARTRILTKTRLLVAAGFVATTAPVTSACHEELSARGANVGESRSGDSGASSAAEASSGRGGSSTPSGGSASTAGSRDGSQGGDSASGSGGSSTSGSGTTSFFDPGVPAADSCIEAGTCPPGKWIDVTPSNANVRTDVGDCGTNYGTKTVQADPAHPGSIYTHFVCQGLWKSTDYGFNWQGPINIGLNGSKVSDCVGQLSIPRTITSKADEPIIFLTCISGAGTGLWKSTNGGVDWSEYAVAPTGAFQQFYPPAIDPYDVNHLLMVVHTQDYLLESVDGGQTWSSVTVDRGMTMNNGGTGGIAFIDTGDQATTHDTWLWAAAASGGGIGLWRTGNAGAKWLHVDSAERAIGSTEWTYQPDTSGVLYMAGVYSSLGWGVIRSSDFGMTWAHVGANQQQSVIFGTSANVYTAAGGAVGPGATVAPSFQTAPQPGAGMWSAPMTPAEMTQGPAQAAVMNDGKHSIIVLGSYNAGLWRYTEP